MYCSNSFTEYIAILPIRLTSGPYTGLSLLQLLSVKTLTPRNAPVLS